jgi:hypothetical protein
MIAHAVEPDACMGAGVRTEEILSGSSTGPKCVVSSHELSPIWEELWFGLSNRLHW